MRPRGRTGSTESAAALSEEAKSRDEGIVKRLRMMSFNTSGRWPETKLKPLFSEQDPSLKTLSDVRRLQWSALSHACDKSVNVGFATTFLLCRMNVEIMLAVRRRSAKKRVVHTTARHIEAACDHCVQQSVRNEPYD